MECNLCGCREFGPMRSRPTARCLKCNSIERSRMMWLYLDQIELPSRARILHFAPELPIYEALKRKHPDAEYVAADIDPDQYSFCESIRHLDMCDMDHLESDHYDLIVHSHVLEHVPCNIAYPLYNIHRILKNEGHHVCIIPFMNGRYEESFQELPPEERMRRFGQSDHVRRFGTQDLSKHLGSLLKIPERYDADVRFGENTLHGANIPRSSWNNFDINSVLHLRKSDMLGFM